MSAEVLSPQSARLVLRKLTSEAVIPSPAKPGDIAYDLHSAADLVLNPNSTTVVGTGLQFCGLECPLNHKLAGHSFVKLESRSGLAARGVFAVGGIVDNGYRGEIKVVLANITNNFISISKGDRIAQAVVYLYNPPVPVSVIEQEPEATERGATGFGSTGK